jgi:hypothetical protein
LDDLTLYQVIITLGDVAFHLEHYLRIMERAASPDSLESYAGGSVSS